MRFLHKYLLRFFFWISGMWSHYSSKVIYSPFAPQQVDPLKVRDMLIHAQTNVSYYQNKIPTVPADSKHLFPFLKNLDFTVSKVDLLSDDKLFIDQRNHKYSNRIGIKAGFIHNLLSGLSKNCLVPINSSGSSGRALKFYKTRKDLQIASIEILQAARYLGWEEGESIVISFQEGMYAQTRFFHRLFGWFGMPLFLYKHINKNSAQKFVNHINKSNATVVIAFASQLTEFALNCKKFNIKVKTPLKFILSVGEMLFKEHRLLIEEVFDVKVYDFYGSSEMGMIAIECKHQKGMHIFENEVFLETDQNNNILATSFNSQYMPFIKYKIGDTGVIREQECTCGIKGKMLVELKGRVDEYLLTEDRERVYASYFRQLLLHCNDFFNGVIIRGQFIQKKDLSISVALQITHDKIPKDKITQIIKERIFKDFNLDVEVNYRLQLLPDKGKFKMLIRE
ncbi:MAG: hypothetical protein MK207_09410 [Saprospiraceae bacterium]|nr:hypothetical protein [Saprospiraceae bacterium]